MDLVTTKEVDFASVSPLSSRRFVSSKIDAEPA